MSSFQIQGNNLKEEFNFGEETLGPNLPFFSTIPFIGIIFFWTKSGFIYLNNGTK